MCIRDRPTVNLKLIIKVPTGDISPNKLLALSLIHIFGATLVGCNLQTIFRGPVLLTSALKVLAVPALACALFFLLTRDAGFAAIMPLYFASPCALLSAVWAKEYGRDLDMAAGSVLVSTVLFFLGVGVYALLR